MKKALISIVALMALVGCASHYDYYQGGVKYTQDGDDCIYSVGEEGDRFSYDIRSLNTNKKIVYRNTRCSDLYARDTAAQAPRQDRQVLVPVAQSYNTYSDQACGCSLCGELQPVSRRKYVLVSAM